MSTGRRTFVLLITCAASPPPGRAVRVELHGCAAVPPVLGVEVLGLGDVAVERPELDALRRTIATAAVALT